VLDGGSGDDRGNELVCVIVKQFLSSDIFYLLDILVYVYAAKIYLLFSSLVIFQTGNRPIKSCQPLYGNHR